MKTIEQLQRIALYNAINNLPNNTVFYENEKCYKETIEQLNLAPQISVKFNAPNLKQELLGHLCISGHTFYFINIDAI